MNGKILMIVPSRDRPELLKIAADSILETTTHCDVGVYVDDDQTDLYGGVLSYLLDTDRVVQVIGPRIGVCPSINAVFRGLPDYSAYGVMIDDAEVRGPGWDDLLLKRWDNGRLVGCASPAHNIGDHMDYSIVSSAWAHALGWVVYPGLMHWCWPSVNEVLGEATNLFRVSPEVMYIYHPNELHSDQGYWHDDCFQFYMFFVMARYRVAIQILKEAAAKAGQALPKGIEIPLSVLGK